MKKYVALLLALSIAVTLAGCASKEEKKAAKNVTWLIDGIGTVSLNGEPAIREARAAYDALSDKAKSLVKNASVLENAYAELNQLYADDVINKINAIGTVSMDSETAISEAQRAYDALPEAAQQLVVNYAVLEAAHEEFARACAESKKTVADNIAAIERAMEAYDTPTAAVLAEETLSLLQKLKDSGQSVGDTDYEQQLTDVLDAIAAICYPNTHILTLNNYISLFGVRDANYKRSDEGETYSSTPTIGNEYHTNHYHNATLMKNAFKAYTGYLDQHFEKRSVEEDSESARYNYVDDLGNPLFVMRKIYTTRDQWGQIYVIFVGFEESVGLRATLSK